MTQINIEGSNHKKGDKYIYIPYEINHDFFLEGIQWGIMKGEINFKNIRIAGPDWGRGWKIGSEKLDTFLDDCTYLNNNLKEILKYVDLPSDMGHADDGYYEGFLYEEGGENTYVESGVRQVTEDDIYSLLEAMIFIANEAKKKGKALEFIGD